VAISGYRPWFSKSPQDERYYDLITILDDACCFSITSRSAGSSVRVPSSSTNCAQPDISRANKI